MSGSRCRPAPGSSWQERFTARFKRLGSRLLLRLFRHEWVAWLALVALLALTHGLLIPRLALEFGFRDIFEDGHPARVRYEAYVDEFELGQRLFVYFSASGVFEPSFLEELARLSSELERLESVKSTFSVLDLTRPDVQGRFMRLRRILRAEIWSDPQRLRQTLREAPFSDRWHGVLYDRDLEVVVLIVTPSVDDRDPRQVRRFMDRLERMAFDAAARHGATVHLNGLLYVSKELLRVTSENQNRLLSVTAVLMFFVLTLLFGRVSVALQILFLLGVSIYLGFGAMAALGVPLNSLSANFPIMVLVIGTADLVHLLGQHCSLRRSYGPRGAAIRAAKRTFAPNLLTSLTTVGCLMVMTMTELNVLRQFATALCLGILIVFTVTIIYAPLLAQRSALGPGTGVYPKIDGRMKSFARGPLMGIAARPAVLHVFALVALLALAISATQRVNSNWFRNFAGHTPVARSLDFLQSRSFPVTSLEATLDVDRELAEVLGDDALLNDLRRIGAAIASLPGVMDVDSLVTLHDFAVESFMKVTSSLSLEPRWRRARREALGRQLFHAGVFDDYYSPQTKQLRLVAPTSFEDSAALIDVGERIQRAVGALELDVLDASGFRLTGQNLYWGEIMSAISETFLLAIIGSFGVIFMGLLAITSSPRRAAIALVPNLLPVLAMCATARLLGNDLTETMCLVVSVAIGVSVDDTVHLLYHYMHRRATGATTPDAIGYAVEVAGTPILVTTVLLMLGYALCGMADLESIRNTGFYLNVTFAVALAADLLLVPSLLLVSEARTEAPRA